MSKKIQQSKILKIMEPICYGCDQVCNENDMIMKCYKLNHSLIK